MPKKKKEEPVVQNPVEEVKTEDTPALLSDLELAEKTISELTETVARAQADFVNYKRRTEAEKISSVSYGIKTAVIAMLPTLDNLQRALAHADPKDELGKGLQVVIKQFEKSLSGLGVEAIKTVGQTFNPETMEAVAIEGDGETEEVAEELQAGYVLNGVVIRHAMVKIKKR